MATKTRKKTVTSKNGTRRERILIDLPESDLLFLKLFAEKFGWQFSSKQKLWEEYINNCPKNIDLSEEEILAEVRTVRYGTV